MQLSNYPKISDHFGRYYTNKNVASVLIDSMGDQMPGLVLDLGVGAGALVAAARKKWDSADFVTVDIDSAADKLGDSEKHPKLVHHKRDALSQRLAENIGVNHGTVDSAICNPPYIRPKWRKHFSEILEDAGLSGVVPKLSALPAEVLFIAQNLRFLKDGGRLGLILPDGIISGEKFSKLRATLASSHNLHKVIELPRRVFRNTDAKAHILVLSKHMTAQQGVEIQKIDSNGVFSKSLRVEFDENNKPGCRLDYSFHAGNVRHEVKDAVALRDITNLAVRGIYSSSEKKSSNFPIFHTTDFAQNSISIPHGFQLTKLERLKAKGSLAEAGDILLARVGRNLEHKVCLVKYGPVALSDCVILLRVDRVHRHRAISMLTSAAGRAALKAVSHGVGAKFVTVESVLNLQV